MNENFLNLAEAPSQGNEFCRITEKILVAEDGAKLLSCTFEPLDSISKATIYFIHGLGDFFGSHRDLFIAFVDRGFRVCALDLRGHGLTLKNALGSNPTSPAGIAGHIGCSLQRVYKDIDLLLASDSFDSRENLFLMGHSMGGMLAISYAIDHGGRTDHIIQKGPPSLSPSYLPNIADLNLSDGGDNLPNYVSLKFSQNPVPGQRELSESENGPTIDDKKRAMSFQIENKTAHPLVDIKKTGHMVENGGESLKSKIYLAKDENHTEEPEVKVESNDEYNSKVKVNVTGMRDHAEHKMVFRGVIASAPALSVSSPIPFAKEFIGRLLSHVIPTFTLDNGLECYKVTRDLDAQKKIQENPLSHQRISLRTAKIILDRGRQLMDIANSPRQALVHPSTRLLITHGTQDVITDGDASRLFVERIAWGGDKSFYPYEGGYHVCKFFFKVYKQGHA